MDEMGFIRGMDKLRDELELSDKEFSRRMGINSGSWSRWKSGKSSITMEKANELCNLFNTSFRQELTIYDILRIGGERP